MCSSDWSGLVTVYWLSGIMGLPCRVDSGGVKRQGTGQEAEIQAAVLPRTQRTGEFSIRECSQTLVWNLGPVNHRESIDRSIPSQGSPEGFIPPSPNPTSSSPLNTYGLMRVLWTFTEEYGQAMSMNRKIKSL